MISTMMNVSFDSVLDQSGRVANYLLKRTNTTSEQCDREKAINELVRGQMSAKRLKIRLQGCTTPLPGEAEHDLAMEVLTCLENTLTIVKSISNSGAAGHENGRRRKYEEHSGRSSTSPGSTKDRRGCYKRFREISDSWIQDNPVLVEDGYRWRKYGQKTIQDTKYLRDYFRCTHNDHGCKAKKHVQRIAENPPLYRTTYFEHHTCNELRTASQFLLNEDHTAPFSLISFGTQPTNINSKSNIKYEDKSSSSSSRNENNHSIINYEDSSSSINDNNSSSWSFLPSPQSSLEEQYKSMMSDLDQPRDPLITIYNNPPSLSQYLMPTHDQTTTTPIWYGLGFHDDDDSFNFPLS